MDVAIGNTTVSNHAQAATGVFHGPVNFSGSSEKRPDRRLRSCRNQIFLTDPSIDRDEIVRAKGDRTQGTCEWIKENEQFQSWLRGEHRLLWIRGGPGKGKTMISVFLSQELDSNEHQSVVYYFCSGQDEKRRTAAAVLRGLIWQITVQHPESINCLLSFFEPSERGFATIASEETLWHLFNTLCRNISPKRLCCLIDGLDECEDDSVYWLSGKLADLNYDSDGCSLSVMVLSRDVSALEGSYCVKLDPDYNTQVNADVHTFVRSRIQRMSSRLQFTEAFEEYVIRVLMEKSESTFLWVGFVVDDLSKKGTCTQIAKALQSLPRGLPAYYASMLERIEPNSREIAARLLTWTAMAFKKLSLKALADVLDCQPSVGITLENVALDEIAICGPMISADKDGAIFVHQSAKEYLLRGERDQDPGLDAFRIQPENAHLCLAQRCLKALSQNSWLQYYALLNWPKHARASGALARHMVDDDEAFFGPSSVARDLWWQKYTPNFPVLPDVIAPRLHIASYLGLIEWARAILSQAEDSNDGFQACLREKCPHGWSPFDYAAEGESGVMMQFLLDNTAESDVIDQSRTASLRRAVLAGSEPKVRLLLDHGVAPVGLGDDGKTMLHQAIALRNRAIIRLLVDRGADLNAPDSLGESSLFYAYFTGHDSLVRLILELGSGAKSLSDEDQEDLAHRAVAHGRFELAKFLFKSGVTVDIPNIFGDTAMHVACMGGNEDMARMLLAMGADPDARTPNGNTALHIACAAGDDNMVRLLLSYAADSNASNQSGNAILHVAAKTGLNRTAKSLSRVVAHGEDGETSADQAYGARYVEHLATMRRYKNIVCALLHHGARVDAIDAEGRTSLQVVINRRSQRRRQRSRPSDTMVWDFLVMQILQES